MAKTGSSSWKRRAVLAVVALAACLGQTAALPAPASACTPVPITSLRDLGPDQVFLVGTTGERVGSGRIFHIELAFNMGVPEREVVIFFQEGPYEAACDVTVVPGTRLFIAPFRDGSGSLAANYATVRSDPDNEFGRAFIAEATVLFGPGVAPPGIPPPAEATSGSAIVAGLILGAALGLGLGLVVLLRRSRRARGRERL